MAPTPPTQKPPPPPSTNESSTMDDDCEIVEIPAFDCSSSRNRKRSKVVPNNVIEIDDDPAGVVITGEKLGLTNKGKAILIGNKKKGADQEKEALPLTLDRTTPTSTTELGSSYDLQLDPLMSSVTEPLTFEDLNKGPFNDNLHAFPYPYDSSSYHGGIMGLQAPFKGPDFSQDALTPNFMTPISSSGLGLGNGILVPQKGSLPGPQYSNNTTIWPFSYSPHSYNSLPFHGGTIGLQAPLEVMSPFPGMAAAFPWYQQPAQINSMSVTSSNLSVPDTLSWCDGLQQPLQIQKKNASTSSATPSQPGHTRDKEEDIDKVLEKYRSFKQFDTVSGYSDHHYANMSSNSKQLSRTWAKTIQQEWNILEKDLPDTIFVRVYEERMDLLRAVIVGAAGTPYHDGLFFFDFFFPDSYPSVPPQVYYYSRGLRLNPNLYNTGYVCLSLLNTWTGSKEEKWTPKKSTVLQVLLSIQALVLNAKPYFNEPGWAPMAGSVSGEKASLQYNETTYILSCRTMLYTLRAPPKHFEEFVAGHFRDRAHAILVACKAYTEGAQVGCLVGEGVQDVDEGDKSCSQMFKMQVGAIIESLVSAFTENGSKDCQRFLPQTNNKRPRTNISITTAGSWGFWS